MFLSDGDGALPTDNELLLVLVLGEMMGPAGMTEKKGRLPPLPFVEVVPVVWVLLVLGVGDGFPGESEGILAAVGEGLRLLKLARVPGNRRGAVGGK